MYFFSTLLIYWFQIYNPVYISIYTFPEYQAYRQLFVYINILNLGQKHILFSQR